MAMAMGLTGNACLFQTRSQPPTLLFLGNSITKSDTNSALGWDHASGMAASSEESDYVHRTLRILKENGREMNGVLGARDCDNAACDGPIEEHLHNLPRVLDLKPEYVVVQLGENSSEVEAYSGKLRSQYRSLLEALDQAGVRRIFCITPWNDTSLSSIRTKCLRLAMTGIVSAQLVDITRISADPANAGDPALFGNRDVLWHPGDAGMDGIAQTLAGAILKDD